MENAREDGELLKFRSRENSALTLRSADLKKYDTPRETDNRVSPFAWDLQHPLSPNSVRRKTKSRAKKLLQRDDSLMEAKVGCRLSLDGYL